jgi:hypothetical protein
MRGAARMSRIRYKQLDQTSFADLEVYSVLPAHPIWSPAAELIDFSFADEICAPLYSTRGPRPYAPSLKLKLHLVQRYYNLSDRQMEERVIGDLFIKRFLGLPVSFVGFDHSTIGLDRERMGDALFDACHHHILSQAKQKGLWGDNKDVWLIDSFSTHGHVARLSAYRLIKQAVLRVINHLKRAHGPLYGQLRRDLKLEPLTARVPAGATDEEGAAAFSRLVLCAYGLLHWFEKATVRPLFWSWKDAGRQLASLERQAILFRILTENTLPVNPDDPNAPIRKRPIPERPANRLISAMDPDVRMGNKRGKAFVGDKIQVVMSAAHDLVLLAEPIPGNETDGEQLQTLVNAVREQHGVEPEAVVGDSAYGHGYHRRAFAKEKRLLAAPMKQVGENYTGLFSNELFRYDANAGSMTCPGDVVTFRKNDNRKLEGTQYVFPKQACQGCSLRVQCTQSENGRRIFISDYYDEFQAAKAFNQTPRAEVLFKLRNNIERKNNEMKNHNGLGHSRTYTRAKRRSYVKLVGMVVNLKQVIKTQGNIHLGFVRKRLPCSAMSKLQRA